MPTLTKNKKIIIGLASVFLVLGVVFIFAAPSAKADIFGIGTIAGNAIMSVLAWVAYAILWFFSRLISVAAFLLQAVFTIEDSTGFTKVTIVTTGWQITRGLCNMFFALILLLMAFDTILQINKFPIKTVLPKLILVALTINFSLVFLGVIIDFAQILTRYFIDAAGGPSHSIADQLANGLNIAKVFQTPTSGLDTGQNIRSVLGGGTASLLTIFGTLAFGIAVILIAFFTIAVGAIFMLIRLVSLWVLLITAPLAWLAMVVPIPGLSSITGDWWKKFFQWTFFAPIYAFFIYLAVLSASTPIFKLAQTPAQQKVTGSIFMNNFLSPDKGLSLLLQYIVTIIILLTGLKTAQSSGLAGAEKVLKGAKDLAGVAGGFAERWAAKGAEKEGTGGWARFRRATSYLAPTPWKAAWKARQDQKEREAMPVAIGARQDLLNKIIHLPVPFRGEKTDYKERAGRFREMQERKDVNTNNAEELVNLFERSKASNQPYKMAAYMRALTEQNDQNEILRYYNKNQGTNYDMNAMGLTNFIDEQMKPTMGEQSSYRLGHDLVRSMENNGQWIGRPFGVDAKTGQYFVTAPGPDVDPEGKIAKKKWSERTDQEKELSMEQAGANAHTEWSKQDPQRQALTLGRFGIVNEGYDKLGNTILKGLSKLGERKITLIQPDQANRLQSHSKAILMFKFAERTKELNVGAFKKILDDYKDRTKGMTHPQIEEFVKNATAHIPKLSEKEIEDAVKMLEKSPENQEERKQRAGFV